MLAAKLSMPAYVTSPSEARVRTQKQNLFTISSVLNQYALDMHKRPHSRDDLVKAGYLKDVPSDPTTGRKDTWVVECSSDPAAPGIASITSGNARSNGKARCG